MTSGTSAPQPDLQAVKQRQQKVWASGDYSKIGSHLLIISELLCEAVDLRPGQRVLDVASGSGNAALAAARRFCDVTSTDYVPALLERGRIRAEAEGLDVTFEVADAEKLPYPDASFDVVLSGIGAMFAPDQEQTAREMLRVCRPGGKIGMANWTSEGLIGDMFRIVGTYLPPPPGLKPPLLWGSEDRLRELFADEITSLQVERRTFTQYFLSLEHSIEFPRTYFGPLKTAYESLDAEGQKNLTQDLLDSNRKFNRSGDETVVTESTYLEVVAVKR